MTSNGRFKDRTISKTNLSKSLILTAVLSVSRARPPPFHLPNCQLCSNLTLSHGNSSPDDLVIPGVFDGENCASRFIRTLGQLCRLALLLQMSA
jgi:hypothetical protein